MVSHFTFNAVERLGSGALSHVEDWRGVGEKQATSRLAIPFVSKGKCGDTALYEPIQ